MGQSQSTPLSLLVANFRDVRTRGQNLSLDIQRGKIITLCRSEWPTFSVGWPPKGTFCLPIIAQVKSKIFLPGHEGHPDQIPYILVWQDLVENPPPWLAPFLSSGTCKVLAMRPADPPKPKIPSVPLYPIWPDSQDLLSLDPPPYHPPPLVPQAPPAPAAPLVTPLIAPLGEPGGREAAAAPGPAAPGPIENETDHEGPAGRTRGRTQREPNTLTSPTPLWPYPCGK